MAGKEAGLIQPSWPRPPLACRVTSASYLTSGSFHGWNMLGVPVALSEYMEVLGATPTHHLVQSACTHGPWHWPPHCVVRSADFLEHPCLKSSEPGACFRFRVSLSLCPSLACTHGAALSPNRDPVGQQWWNKAPPLAKGVSATSQSPQPLHMGPCPPPQPVDRLHGSGGQLATCGFRSGGRDPRVREGGPRTRRQTQPMLVT